MSEPNAGGYRGRMLMRRPRRFSPRRRRGGPPRSGGGGGGRTGGGGSGGGDNSNGPLSHEPEHPFVQAVLGLAVMVGAFLAIPVVFVGIQILLDVTGLKHDP
jgi:hypothetical protein